MTNIWYKKNNTGLLTNIWYKKNNTGLLTNIWYKKNNSGSLANIWYKKNYTGKIAPRSEKNLVNKKHVKYNWNNFLQAANKQTALKLSDKTA